MKTLIVTLEIDVRDMTAEELAECDICDEGDDNEDTPSVEDYRPEEIAELLPYVLALEDTQAEIFSGSMVFAKFTAVRCASASFKDTPHTTVDPSGGEI
jgi:hypothetical protein